MSSRCAAVALRVGTAIASAPVAAPAGERTGVVAVQVPVPNSSMPVSRPPGSTREVVEQIEHRDRSGTGCDANEVRAGVGGSTTRSA